MALKQIPGCYLHEALEAANQLAHSKEAHEIELEHVVFGAFHSLLKYQKRILSHEESSTRLNSMFERICNKLDVPKNLPEKNGATNSCIVEQLLTNVRRRALQSSRRLLLLEDLLVVLLNTQSVTTMLSRREEDRQFLMSIREACMHPVQPVVCKKPVATRPQYNRRKRGVLRRGR